MRNFADLVRIPAPEKRPVDLLRLVKNVTDLMQLKAGEKKVNFLYERDSLALMIQADHQQMEQVLINIIKNALEAIEAEGIITILIRDAYPKHLIIRDTGTGILPEMEEHLFSPFYSTKKDGQGVGLTVIKEILLNHQFGFTLRTPAPGRTEFKIVFE